MRTTGDGQRLGPSTTVEPYLRPLAPGVEIVSILSVPESAGVTVSKSDLPEFSVAHQPTQRTVVGVLDGLGIYLNEESSCDANDENSYPSYGVHNAKRNQKEFTLLSNHEILAGRVTQGPDGPLVDPVRGIPRRHHTTEAGSGALVTRWKIGADVKVHSQEDQVQRIQVWDRTTNSYRPANPANLFVYTDSATGRVTTYSEQDFTRLCSSDIPFESAFFDPRSQDDLLEKEEQCRGCGKDLKPFKKQRTGCEPKPNGWEDLSRAVGTRSRLMLGGEEVIWGGRAFAHCATGPQAGTSYELPGVGRLSFENFVACPFRQPLTLAIALSHEDTPDDIGNVIAVWVGQKRGPVGDPVRSEPEMAGLLHGTLYGLSVPGWGPRETRECNIGLKRGHARRFVLKPVSDQAQGPQPIAYPSRTAVELIEAGSTSFLRPEDGAWDPSRLPLGPKEQWFYFATTDQFDFAKACVPGNQVGRSRLWRIEFDDVGRPELGGKIRLMLDGTEGYQDLDNVTVDFAGRVLLSEDPQLPPGVIYRAKVWVYEPGVCGKGRKGATLTLIAELDGRQPAVQQAGSNAETSGILQIEQALGPGWSLIDVQLHRFVQQWPEFVALYGPRIAQESVELSQLLAIYVPPCLEGTPLPAPAILPKFCRGKK